MFAKPYKIKSNNTLKNSEKKNLVQRLQEAFSKATDENLKEIVSIKSTCICMKLVLYNDETVNVYAVDGAPMIIEREQELVPTVCALWKVPDLVPTLTIHTPVLSKVQGGAPLYLPGVAIPTAGVGFPQFQRGSIIAMCTGDNSAAGIIGRASMSSGDMLLRAAGVCMETLHVVGDQLCKDDKFSPLERPKRGPLACSQVADITNEVSQLSLSAPREQWPALGAARAQNLPRLIPDPLPPTEEPHPAPSPEQSAAEGVAEVGAENEGGEEGQVPSDMEGLLRWSLLSFLKRGARHVELPLKTSLLYRNHLLPLCPEGRTLDVKKSSYKKMSKFLEAMQEEGLVEVREIEKGVSAVVGVQLLHPAVRAHAPPALAPAPALAAAHAPAHAAYRPPLVREMFCVTAAVADLFAPIKKGTALTPAEVRTTLTEYVKRKELTSAQTKGAVTLDAVLAKIVGQPEQACMKWEPLMAGVQARMTASTEMRFADGGVALSKARLEPVTMHVATRSGNKKVTLVSNLEAFGFKLSELSHVCQVGVAASCGVTRSPGAKADQLMLQGDQTHFVAKLLIEKYGLPKKFVEGADKALKKKK